MAVAAVQVAGERPVAGLGHQGIYADLEDHFESVQASTDLLVCWTHGEKRSTDCPQRRLHGLPVDVRRTALHLLSSLVSTVGLPRDSWFAAAQMMDASDVALAGSKEDPKHTIPATCLAIVLLLRKMDAAVCSMNQADFSRLAATVSQQWQASGFDRPHGMTFEDVLVQQQRLLCDAKLRVLAPSLGSWLHILATRFKVLVHEGAMVDLAYDWSLQAAHFLVMLRPGVEGGSLKAVSIGLFGLGLAAVGLMPLAAIRPWHIQPEDWERRFRASHQQAGVTPPPSAHADGDALRLWGAALAVAAASPLEEVQASCLLTGDALRLAGEAPAAP
mmetsp:Transcript_81567/g.205239  ORF Transcript_81567/g.205239 Transcript_81567/m.205239 type:complete len:331 (-) Transcript_81567:186-1178(-)